MELQILAGYVLGIVKIVVLVTIIYALVHAAMQRPDAYTAVDKLTKPVWLVILGLGLLLALVLDITGTAIAVMMSVSLNALIVSGVVSASQAGPKPPSNVRQKTIASGPTRMTAR